MFCLSIHADYACRHSGACCTAQWRIPVERECEARLTAAAARAGSVPALDRDGSLVVLATGPDGACAFLDRERSSRRCSIHRELGHAALPAACQHFPRVPVTDDDSTFVTLSHFCPTAAAMLLREDPALSIVRAPAEFNAVPAYDGLDARGVLPPLLRPGLLMDLAAHHAWQRRVVRVLAERGHSAESALARIAAAADSLQQWRPGGRSLLERIATLRADPPGSRVPASAGARWVGFQSCLELHEMVRGCLLEGLSWPAAPAELAEADSKFVAPGWRALAGPVRRYLAARAFASWIPWSGGTLDTGVAAIVAARAVLRVEAGRRCAAAGRALDRVLLLEAIRRADLLLVHQVSPGRLARMLADRWRGPGQRDHGR